MPRRYPVPHQWLMTDERLGDDLWPALKRLPRGSGVVFRHHGLPLHERRALFARVARLCRARGLVLVRAGRRRLGREDGVHGQGRGPGIRTWSAHDRREAVAGVRAGADLLFVSPVFPTRSHPGAPSLGRVRLGLLIRGLQAPVIALGGMDARRARTVGAVGVYGWAAIDAWTGAQRFGPNPPL
jgi:thiamine-phosphate pyrophosphorylase